MGSVVHSAVSLATFAVPQKVLAVRGAIVEEGAVSSLVGGFSKIHFFRIRNAKCKCCLVCTTLRWTRVGEEK